VNPKSASAAMNLSQALLTTGALDEADEALVRALQNGYNDPDGAATRRADWYEGLAQKQPSARAQMKKYATRLVAAFPVKDRYRVLLGRALFASEDCPGAEAALDPVVARNAKDVEALNLLGLAAMCQGNVAKAKGLFQRSLAIEPHQPAIREGLSRLQ
jgi:Flp pilus assembly protein TadD